MDSAVFNCLLQLGYFWATLVIMCALYGGIYRVALRLHRESAARRRTVAAVAAQTSSHQQVPAAADSASSVALRPPVVMATVSAAGRDHIHHQSRTSSPDLSLSEHDVVATRRHDDANDVTLLLPVPVELTQAYTSSSTCVTFTVDDVDIRFADDVTDDEDDDIVGRRLISTSGSDAILQPHQQQQQSDRAWSRETKSMPEPDATFRHSVECHELARVDSAGVPARRRFCGTRLLSSRRRQRRSKTCMDPAPASSSSQVIEQLSSAIDSRRGQVIDELSHAPSTPLHTSHDSFTRCFIVMCRVYY